jgi:hypothetical protein
VSEAVSVYVVVYLRLKSLNCSITIEIQGKKDFVLVQGIPIILKILDLNDDLLCLYDIAVSLLNSHFSLKIISAVYHHIL